MKKHITNKLNLQRALVLAIQNDPYDPDDGGQKSDYTITGLLKPPRAAQIARTETIVEDAADSLYSLQGQEMHSILERGKEGLEALGFVVEKRFYRTYTVDGKDLVVSAKIDVFDPAFGHLSDWKYTSTSSARKGLKEEHSAQVNFQARLLRQTGFVVEKADATILMRDWNTMQAYREAIVRVDGSLTFALLPNEYGYPLSPTLDHKVTLMSDDEVDNFIVERIRLHEAAKQQLPECTPEERWSRPTFAVMKDTIASKATRVFDSRQEAETFVKGKGAGIVVERPGRSIRCLRYCPVRSICSQAKEVLKQEAEASDPKDSDGFFKVK